MSDGITHEMIVAKQRKEALIEGIAQLLDGRIAHGAALPDMTPGTLLELQAMRDKMLIDARNRPVAFFANLRDVNDALRALKPVKS